MDIVLIVGQLDVVPLRIIESERERMGEGERERKRERVLKG
jgi:hypothetical protein